MFETMTLDPRTLIIKSDNEEDLPEIIHELVGHREAGLKGWTQPTLVMEEAQASIRAARFAPGLNTGERIDLIRDTVHRLNKRGLSLRSVKTELFINER